MTGKRYSPKMPTRQTPLGVRTANIGDPEILSCLGTICYKWSHVEEGMISVLGRLIPGGAIVDTHEVARQILRALASQRAKMDVMRSLLERSRHNKDKGPEYDDVLKRFGEANQTRNEYVHGLWWTHESGNTFLEKPTADELGFHKAKLVTVTELDDFILRLEELARLIYIAL